MILIKALATAVFFGVIGLLIGSIVGLLFIPTPEHVCGAYWIIPMATGAAVAGGIGSVAGLLIGLIF